jgi:hypothetical protein
MGLHRERDEIAKRAIQRRIDQEAREATPMYGEPVFTPEQSEAIGQELDRRWSKLHPNSEAYVPVKGGIANGQHTRYDSVGFEDLHPERKLREPDPYEYNEQLQRMTPTELAEYAALPVPHRALADLHWEASYDMGVQIPSAEADRNRDTIKRYLFSPEEMARIVNSLFFEGPIGPELTQRISDLAKEWEG